MKIKADYLWNCRWLIGTFGHYPRNPVMTYLFRGRDGHFERRRKNRIWILNINEQFDHVNNGKKQYLIHSCHVRLSTENDYISEYVIAKFHPKAISAGFVVSNFLWNSKKCNFLKKEKTSWNIQIQIKSKRKDKKIIMQIWPRKWNLRIYAELFKTCS